MHCFKCFYSILTKMPLEEYILTLYARIADSEKVLNYELYC